jgi:hypothetical protein
MDNSACYQHNTRRYTPGDSYLIWSPRTGNIICKIFVYSVALWSNGQSLFLQYYPLEDAREITGINILVKGDTRRISASEFVFIDNSKCPLFEKIFSIMWNIYPRNWPWGPIGLWDVKDSTFSRQSTHRWRYGCQPYALAALLFLCFWYSFLFEAE